MRSSHAAVHVSAIAERVGLPALATQVRIEAAGNSGGAHPAAKVMSLLGAMCSGADSIDDADRLRHGAMDRAFAGIRAPSTLRTPVRRRAGGPPRSRRTVVDAARRPGPSRSGATSIRRVVVLRSEWMAASLVEAHAEAWRGIATRYDKTPESYLAGLHLHAPVICIKDLTRTGAESRAGHRT